MRIEKNPRKFSLFIISSYAIFIFIVTQVLSWSLYYNFEKSGTELTNSLSRKNLDIAVNSIQKDLGSVKLYCQQLFVDNDILKLMYGNITDQQQLNMITYRLTSYSVISSYIHSIYVYNRKYDYFYCSNQAFSDYADRFYDQDIRTTIKEAKITQFAPVLRAVPSPYNPDNLTQVYSYILYDNYSDKKLSDAALVVNIKADEVVRYLESMKYQDNSSYLVLNTDGIIVASSEPKNFNKSITDDKSLNRIFADIKGAGSFTFSSGDSVLFAQYRYSPDLRWTFVNTTPYDVLFKSVGKTKNTMLLINLSVLILAILASLVLSININNPVKSLISRTQADDKLKKENFTSFRRNLLEGLLQNGINLQTAEETFKEFHIKLDLNRETLLIHAKIDHAAAFHDEYDAKDRRLMLYSVGNITGEILQESYVSEYAESDKDYVDIIVNPGREPAESTRDRIDSLLRKAQGEISRYLNLSVSFTVSGIIQDPRKLREEYNRVKELSSCRFIKGHASIIHTPDMLRQEESFRYPYGSQKQLLDALLLGKQQAVESIYSEMVKEVVQYPYNDILQFFIQFALSLNSLIQKLNTTANAGIDFEFYRFVTFLNSAETISEINELSGQLFKEICNTLQPDREDKSRELISSIDGYIEKNYHDPNLSLNSIADFLDKSPAYLGRLYRKLTGLSLPDRINDFRLKKAMELLSGSSAKIEDICNDIGFPNEKYFYLFFKKHVGITPNEFRNRKTAH
jgi:AraC-like DNA-binding protein